VGDDFRDATCVSVLSRYTLPSRRFYLLVDNSDWDFVGRFVFWSAGKVNKTLSQRADCSYAGVGCQRYGDRSTDACVVIATMKLRLDETPFTVLCIEK
jgi:hypothetical protein